jgi:hypothetical protein
MLNWAADCGSFDAAPYGVGSKYAEVYEQAPVSSRRGNRSSDNQHALYRIDDRPASRRYSFSQLEIYFFHA